MMAQVTTEPLSKERPVRPSSIAAHDDPGNHPTRGCYRDLTGQVFGRLTCMEDVGRDKRRNSLWLCRCACGNTVVVSAAKLMRGNTRSCGCLRNDLARERRTTHGLSRDTNGGHRRTYQIWVGMRQRCSNPNRREYPRYGGRGITVCDEWQADYKAFYDWAMAHGYREELTLDRIDNDGPYAPSNCRWASPLEQSMNCRMRANTVWATLNGETKPLIEWARLLGIDYKKAYHRLKQGFSAEESLASPATRHEDKEACDHA